MSDQVPVLSGVVRELAVTAGDSIFLQEVDGECWTFKRMHEHTGRWAAGLTALGIHKGQNVLTMLPNGGETVAVWSSLSRLGAVEVPINIAFKGRMLTHIVATSQANTIVIDTQFLPRLWEAWGPEVAIQTIVIADGPAPAVAPIDGPRIVSRSELLDPETLAAIGEIPEADIKPWDPACILFTSGTTGPSKGAVMPWRLMAEIWDGLGPSRSLTSSDVYYLPLPVFHMGAKCFVMLMAMKGGTVVIKDGFAPEDFWDDIDRFGCTTTLMLGTMAGLILNHAPGRRESTLRNVLMVPRVPEADAMRRDWGVRIFTWYGLTEGGVPVAIADWDADRSGSSGKANPNFELRIVDQHDEDVPYGTVGELVMRPRRPWIMFDGYWAMPEKTTESYRNLWFHTGDAMYRDQDGNYFFVDRITDSIRRKGENISSAEVERDVIEHPAVLECAAIPVRAALGEDEIKVCLVLREDHEFDPAELLQFLLARMPHFMVPRYIEVLDELPKTPTEKVRKAELRESGITASTWDRVAAGVRLRDLQIAERG